MMTRIDCREARRALWPGDSLRLSDERVEAALAHADECESCSGFLDRDRRVAALVRDSMPRTEAPRELRERLYTALARERAGETGRSKWRGRGAWKVATALFLGGLALAGAGRWLIGHGDARSPASAFAEDYLRRAVEQDVLVTSDRERVGAFFARELGISAQPPRLPGYEVKRAVICLMNGRRGGVVEYTSGGKSLSYYVLPDEGDGTGLPHEFDARRIEWGSERPTAAAARGLGVATWRDGEHQHALVGNLSPETLEEIAALFATPAIRL